MDKIAEELEAQRLKEEQEVDRTFDSLNEFIDDNGFIKNKDFTQFFDSSNIHLLNLMLTDTTAASVLVLMTRLMERNNTIKIRKKDIEEILGKSESTIKRAINTLKSKNYLTTIKEGREIIYFINPMVATRTAAINKTNSLKEYKRRAGTLKVDNSNKVIQENKYIQFLKKERQIFRFESKKVYKKPDMDEHVEKLYEAEKLREIEKKKESDAAKLEDIPDGFGGFED